MKLLNHGGPSYYIHVYNCKFRDKIVDDYIGIILNKINFVGMVIFLLTILLHLNENDQSLICCNYIIASSCSQLDKGSTYTMGVPKS